MQPLIDQPVADLPDFAVVAPAIGLGKDGRPVEPRSLAVGKGVLVTVRPVFVCIELDMAWRRWRGRDGSARTRCHDRSVPGVSQPGPARLAHGRSLSRYR